MSPAIISDTHEKILLNKRQLKEYDLFRVAPDVIKHNFGPDEQTVRFSMLENDASGVLTIEIMNGSEVEEVVGNISFEKINEPMGSCLENSVQIKSAYLDVNYRGEGLAITAYEIIARRYLLVSDNIQTHDGSSFWKFKIGDHDNLEVNIVSRPKIGIPYKICDSNEQPIVYNYSKEELEPMIWGLEHPNNSVHRFINANQNLSRDDVVLVALYQE